MGDVVNFKLFRKQQERLSKRRRAAANRTRTGQSKSEASASAFERERRRGEHEGRKLERPASLPEEPDNA